MNTELIVERCFSEDEVRALAEKLNEYAQKLPENEVQALFQILIRAMEPLDRFRYLKTSDILSSDEEEFLHLMENESKKE